MAIFRNETKTGFLILLGILVHTIVLLSVFDIYFQSPILLDIDPIYPPRPPPAKRLVLIVADGLRADKCFNAKFDDGTPAARYIRWIAGAKGVAGLSFTRVPTESRPGHVAIIAGFYEDVSAVTRGWKENPVEFDSVFNRSRHTWSWGSPDILPMFAKGTTGSRVATYCYSAEEENFADSNPSRLDTWVFDNFHEFLAEAKNNATLRAMVSQDGIIFFLHLLGLDTMGHSRKPWSKEYIDAIQVVDHGIQQMVKEVEEFYQNDSQTSYIFTADHGMTDWGSHGSSEPEETNTPFVAWGAGIRAALSSKNGEAAASSEQPSHPLPVGVQVSIQQADIAPLMSALVGIAFPVNSVGVIPLAVLNGSDCFKAQCVLRNAQQIGKQFEKHWKLKELRSLPFFFRPFRKLPLHTLHSKYEVLARLLDDDHPNQVIQEAGKLISVMLEGIRYFQTYSRLSLRFSVVSGLVGWVVLISCWMYEDHLSSSLCLDRAFSTSHSKVENRPRISSAPFLVLALVIIILLYRMQDPITYYLYYLLPVLTWGLVNVRRDVLLMAIFATWQNFRQVFQFAIVLFLGVELLVFAFFSRETIAIGLFFLSPWSFYCNAKIDNKILPFLWTFSCCGLAVIFPLLLPVGREANYNLVLVAGFLSSSIASLVLYKGIVCDWLILKSAKWLILIQILFLAISTCNIWIISSYISENVRVPSINHFISWIVLGTSLLLPLFGSTVLLCRLFHVLLSLLTSFILLSFTFEALILIWFMGLLVVWLILETKVERISVDELLTITFGKSVVQKSAAIHFSDVRRAYFSLFLLMASFFVLGNVANVNSFSPTSVYCFVTIFSPFTMGFLLLLKILFPFLAVSTLSRSVQIATGRSPSQLFWLILLLCDIMVLNFFFLVRDEGSWLEIGSSIGRFVIVMGTSIAFILLYFFSALLTNPSILSHLHLPKKHSS